MSDALQAMIDKHKERIKLLRDVFERDDRLYAVSTRDPSYSILLSRNTGSEVAVARHVIPRQGGADWAS